MYRITPPLSEAVAHTNVYSIEVVGDRRQTIVGQVQIVSVQFIRE